MSRLGGRSSVVVGARGSPLRQDPSLADRLDTDSGEWSGLRAWVLVDGSPAGTIDYADRLRPDLHAMLARLATLGIKRTMLLTGDRRVHAERVAEALGIQEVRADLLPVDKVVAVEALERAASASSCWAMAPTTLPTLRRATVGVALAAHGGGITAEAADAVILTDDLSRLADAIAISRRTMSIARQSIWVGLVSSAAAMLVAALATSLPRSGQVLQEVIDIAVILNALRASGEAGSIA